MAIEYVYSQDGNERWYNNEFQCELVEVEMKKSQYHLTIETTAGSTFDSAKVTPDISIMTADAIKVCEYMYSIVSDKQRSCGARLRITAQITEVKRWGNFTRKDSKYVKIDADKAQLAIARDWYNRVKTTRVTEAQIIDSVHSDNSGWRVIYFPESNLNKTNRSTRDLSANTNDFINDATRKAIESLLVVPGASNGVSSYQFKLLKTEETSNTRPKSVTTIIWDIPKPEITRINTAVKRTSNALGRVNWNSKSASEILNTVSNVSSAIANFQYDVVPNPDNPVSSWIYGTVVGVIDGDTIDVRVIDSNNVKYYYSPDAGSDLIPGKDYRVRLVGVDTPEIAKSNPQGQADADKRNEAWLVKHRLPADRIDIPYTIAGEAKNFVTEILLGQDVFIDCETEDNGNGPGMDLVKDNRRLLGVVYLMLDYPNSLRGIHMNKTLIASLSKAHQDKNLSLADVWYYDRDGVIKTKFPNILGWSKLDPDAYKEKPVDTDPVLQQIVEEFLNGQNLLDINGNVWYTEEEINVPGNVKREPGSPSMHNQNNEQWAPHPEYFSNLNPIIDDNDESEFDPYGEMATPFHLRLGDVTLIVPPLSIKVAQLSKNTKVNTLRNRNAIQVQSGYSDYQITLELFFHNIEAINGRSVNNPMHASGVPEALKKMWPEPYHVDGLRALIAEFMKAPFVPIYNEFLEDTYGIQSVALESLHISTVPGFPNTLAVNLILTKFDHTAYMPDTHDLGRSFNWPIFRWYLQDALQPRYISQEDPLTGEVKEILDPHHIYIPPIKGQMNDDIKFYVADENALKVRYEAIKTLRSKYSPSDFASINEDTDTRLGQLKKDGEILELATKQYENFKTAIKKYPKSKHPTWYTDKGIFSTKGKDASVDIFNENQAMPTPGMPAAFQFLEDVYKGAHSARDCYFVMNYQEATASNTPFSVYRKSAKPVDSSKVDVSLNLGDNKAGGWYIIPIYSELIQSKLPPTSLVGKSKDGKAEVKWYFINPSDTALIKALKDLCAEGNASFEGYADEVAALARTADISEGNIPMIEWEVKDLHVLAVSGSLNNVLTKLQVQELESPTIQYMGGQETYFTIAAQTKSRETIQSLREMYQYVQGLTRQYRVAINSGFLDISNDLVNFMGTRSIIIEQLEVDTVQGTPELFNVTIHCTAFDKTQKEKETPDQIQLRNEVQGPYDFEKFQSFFDKNSTNEDKQFVIFDYKLKQQEVYPDLDLPTWTEFAAALPYLNCGIPSMSYLREKIRKMTGLDMNHGKYVDPDFYVNCEWTNRTETYKALKDKDVRALLLSDDYGSRLVEYAPEDSETELYAPNVSVNERFKELDKQIRDSILERINAHEGELMELKSQMDTLAAQGSGSQLIYTDPVTGYTKQVNPSAIPEGSPPRVNTSVSKAQDPSNKKDTKIMTFENLVKPPTVDEIIRWFGQNSRYQGNLYEWARGIASTPSGFFKNPSEAEIASEIARLVDMYWSFSPNAKMESQNDYVYGAKGIGLPTITRRKVINAIKALIFTESTFMQFFPKPVVIGGRKYNVSPHFPTNKRWQHKDNYIEAGNIVPVVDKHGTTGVAAGLGQMVCAIAGYAKDLDEARRVAWDWRYNLQKCIAKVANDYDYAMKKSSVEPSTMPLDYALVYYERYDRTMNDDYYQTVFKNFSQKYSGPHQKHADSSQDRNPISAMEDNASIIKEYAIEWSGSSQFKGYPNFLNYFNSNAEGEGKNRTIKIRLLDDTPDGADPKKYGSTEAGGRSYAYDTIEIKTKKYNAILKAIEEYLAAGNAFNHKVNLIVVDSKEEKQFNSSTRMQEEIITYRATIGEGNSVNEVINNYVYLKTMEGAQFLPKAVSTPSEALYGSFIDSIEYDARGRLVRAFPAFQMFIIDEGRWQLWYKMWDNMYGYNSIQSIDIVRDRKIAADTAIISMTNVYSNLTTKESRYADRDWSFSFWNMFFGSRQDYVEHIQTLFEVPNDDIVRARAEHLDTLMLKPGARIHLRMGYGSNASEMPVVFNGTITEMDAQEVVTIIAQGDGIELCNKLNAKPNDTNDPGAIFSIIDPREAMCNLLSSKGSQIKDWINYVTGGFMFKGHPLGISHFGQTDKVPKALAKWWPFRSPEDDYGEVGINIYSANGYETFSHWVCNGLVDKVDTFNNSDELTWGRRPHENFERVEPPKIEVFLYDKTVWDIANTFAMAVPDYICAVHPFEFRSTLFYGKPMFGLSYKYDYVFWYDKENKEITRKITHEFRKPYSQFHVLQGFSDIISNEIKATESNVYTNVIVAYGGKKELTTPIVQADSDIYIDKQKTAIARADLNAQPLSGWGFFGVNYWTSEAVALTIGANTIREYMHDMYDGQLIVLGYPSIKPHDKFYLEDHYNDMQGAAGVQRVIHHMSFETGFVTNITPDCICIVDDLQQLSLLSWQIAKASGIVGGQVAKYFAGKLVNRLFRKLIGRSYTANADEVGKALGGLIGTFVDATDAQTIKLADEIMDAIRSNRKISNSISAIKWSTKQSSLVQGAQQFLFGIDKIMDTGKAWKEVGRTAKLLRVVKGAACAVEIGLGIVGPILLNIGVEILTNGLIEMYRRWRRNRQAVVIVPLKYRGKPYVAGINGHKGLIHGEPPGYWDKWIEDNFGWLDALLFDERSNPSLRHRPKDPGDWIV